MRAPARTANALIVFALLLSAVCVWSAPRSPTKFAVRRAHNDTLHDINLTSSQLYPPPSGCWEFPQHNHIQPAAKHTARTVEWANCEKCYNRISHTTANDGSDTHAQAIIFRLPDECLRMYILCRLMRQRYAKCVAICVHIALIAVGAALARSPPAATAPQSDTVLVLGGFVFVGAGAVSPRAKVCSKLRSRSMGHGHHHGHERKPQLVFCKTVYRQQHFPTRASRVPSIICLAVRGSEQSLANMLRRGKQRARVVHMLRPRRILRQTMPAPKFSTATRRLLSVETLR